MPGRLLAITGGHRFDADAFERMLDAVCAELGWVWAHARQPAAQRWLHPDHSGEWDAIFLYDIPGLDLARGAEPITHDPPPDVRAAIAELLARGQGVVAAHHALAGWPAWEGWAEILGGRFCYAPGRLRGRDVPASGYRMDTYRVDVVASDHPVCEGVSSFEVDDELYLCPVFEDEVTPLLTTDAEITSDTTIDTYREVVEGIRAPGPEQDSSRLIGWTQDVGASRVVYLLPGHGPSTMDHPTYRRILANAFSWVSRA